MRETTSIELSRTDNEAALAKGGELMRARANLHTNTHTYVYTHIHASTNDEAVFIERVAECRAYNVQIIRGHGTGDLHATNEAWKTVIASSPPLTC